MRLPEEARRQLDAGRGARRGARVPRRVRGARASPRVWSAAAVPRIRSSTDSAACSARSVVAIAAPGLAARREQRVPDRARFDVELAAELREDHDVEPAVPRRSTARTNASSTRRRLPASRRAGWPAPRASARGSARSTPSTARRPPSAQARARRSISSVGSVSSSLSAPGHSAANARSVARAAASSPTPPARSSRIRSYLGSSAAATRWRRPCCTL